MESYSQKPPPSAGPKSYSVRTVAHASDSSSDVDDDDLNDMLRAFHSAASVVVNVKSDRAPIEQVRITTPSVVRSDNTIVQALIEGDQVQWGPNLDVMRVNVEKSDAETRYNIDDQLESLHKAITIELQPRLTNTLLEANYARKIKKVVDSFLNLHQSFSELTSELEFRQKTLPPPDEHRPLVAALSSMDFAGSPWYVPTVHSTRKLYDIEIENVPDDVVKVEHMVELKRLSDFLTVRETTDDNRKTFLKDLQMIMNEYSPNITDSVCIVTDVIKTSADVIINNATHEGVYLASAASEKGDHVIQSEFVVYRANSGIQMLVTSEREKKMRSRSKVYVDVAEKNGDELCVRSLLCLPLPAILLHGKGRPNSTIMDKVTFSQNYPYLFRSVNTVSRVSNFDNALPELRENIVEFIPRDENVELTGSKSSASSANDGFDTYVRDCVPNANQAYSACTGQYESVYSLMEIMHQLESFHFEHDDIHYSLYKKMLVELKGRVKRLKQHVQTQRDVTAKRIERYAKQEIVHPEYVSKEKLAKVLAVYQFQGRECHTYEMMQHFTQKDGMAVFLAMLAMENFALHNPALIGETERNIEDLSDHAPTKKDKECLEKRARLVLAKSYYSQNAVDADSRLPNAEVFFDKEHDPTRYDVVNEAVHRDARERLGMDEYRNYLTQHFETNVGLSTDEAVHEAISVSNNKRTVRDGEYARIFNESMIKYLVRKEGVWIEDSTVKVENFEEEDCDVTKECHKADDCSSLDTAYRKLNADTLRTLIFSGAYDIEHSQTERRGQLEEMLKARQLKLERKHTRMNNEIQKMENYSGIQINDILSTESPYARLRDKILKLTDLVKKQRYIRKFVELCTRKSRASKNEDSEWLYCKQTGEKLLPAFLEKIAVAAEQGSESYLNTLTHIRDHQGETQGNQVVHVKTGYIITHIDFDNSDVFDTSGKPIKREAIDENVPGQISSDVSRDVLSNIDNIEQIINSKPKFSVDTMRMIANITVAMYNAMSIHPEKPQFTSIVMNTLDAMENSKAKIMDREGWKRARTNDVAFDRAKHSNGSDDEWAFHYHLTIMRITLANIIIHITIRIPSYTATRSWGTCHQSFDGFPVPNSQEETEGLTLDCLNYVCCIAHGMRRSVDPWSSLKRMKLEKIKDFVRDFIQQRIDNKRYKREIDLKEQYLMTVDTSDTPRVERASSVMYAAWPRFLPYLKRIEFVHSQAKIPSVSDREEVKRRKTVYMSHLKNEMFDVFNDLKIAQSIVRSMAMQIQSVMQDIINKEEPLLIDGSYDAYTINSCCIYKDTNAWKFFLDKAPHLAQMNDYVRFIANNYHEHFIALTRGNCLNTYRKNRTRLTKTEYAFEKLTADKQRLIVYEVMIHACSLMKKLTRNAPGYVGELCERRDEAVAVLADMQNATHAERVYQLRSRRFDYDVTHMDILLRRASSQTASLMNYSKFSRETHYAQRNVALNAKDPLLALIMRSERNNAEDVIDQINREFVRKTGELKEILPKNLYDSLYALLTCDTKIKAGMDIDYTERKDRSEMRRIHSSYHFIKECIMNVGITFPTMILQGNIRNDMPHGIPSYWKLSKNHISDIERIIGRYYVQMLPLTNDPDKVYSHILTGLVAFASETVAFVRNAYGLHVHSSTRSDAYSELFGNDVARRVIRYLLTSLFHYLVVGQNSNAKYSKDKLLKAGVEICKSFVVQMNEMITVWNHTYEEITQHTKYLQYHDRDIIAGKFIELTHEDRYLQNELKRYRLGEWNIDVKNGVKVYDADTYDRERGMYEMHELNEMGDNTERFTRDIYSDDYAPPGHEVSVSRNDIEEDEEGYSDGEKSDGD